MTKTSIQYKYLEEFIVKIRSKGRHAFSLTEVKEHFDLSEKAINQNLFRLKSKNKIAQIRKGFYAIISPEYSGQGMIPAPLFIGDLMQLLKKRYYVGLVSAAALHGAANQQPMEFFVVTEKPTLRRISNKKIKINFYVKKDWKKEDILKIKTDAGDINVSSPELTALDLLYYTDKIGINYAVTILHELVNEMKVPRLIKTARHYPQMAAIQRLGYLLDKELQNKKLADALYKAIIDKKIFPVSISNQKNEGEMDDKWKVIKNIIIENDI